MLRIATRGSALGALAGRARRRAARRRRRVRVRRRRPATATRRSDLHAIGGTGRVHQGGAAGRARRPRRHRGALGQGSAVGDAAPGSCSRRFPSAATRATRSSASRSTSSRPVARIGTGSVRRRAQLAAPPPGPRVRPAARQHRDAPAQARRRGIRRGRRRVRRARAARARGRGRPRCSIPRVMLPQVAQGALGVECRADDAETRARLAAIDDADAHRAVDRGARVPRRARRRVQPAVRRARDRIDVTRLVLDALLASLDGHVVLRTRVARTPIPTTSAEPPRPTCSTARAAAALLDAEGVVAVTVYLVGAGPGRSRAADASAARSCCAAPTSSSTTGLRRRRCSSSRPPRAERVDVGKAPGSRRDDAGRRSTTCSSTRGPRRQGGRAAEGRRPVRVRARRRRSRGVHRGAGAVRSRARHHERDRRARVRGHPRDAPRACRRASRS